MQIKQELGWKSEAQVLWTDESKCEIFGSNDVQTEWEVTQDFCTLLYPGSLLLNLGLYTARIFERLPFWKFHKFISLN